VRSSALLCVLVALAALAAPARALDAIFADDFSGRALASERYVRRDGVVHPLEGRRPSWTVKDGALRFDTRGVAESRLGIMAQAGPRFTLDVRIRFPEGERFAGGVLFCDDYRLQDGLYFGLYRDAEHSGVQILGLDFTDWKDLPLEAGRWYALRVSRRGARFTLSVDGAKVFERTVTRTPEEHPAYQTEPLRHTGFSLAARHMTHDYAIEWDDLSVKGDAPDAPKLLRRASVALASGPAELNVLHYRGSEAWAQGILEEAPGWIARMEALVGTPPCARTLTYNEQRGTYYERRGGFNEWGQVLLGTSITGVGGHEECHFWQHLYGAGWANEGMADFFPALLRAREGKARLRSASLLGELRSHVVARSPALAAPLEGGEPGAGPTKEGHVPLAMFLGGLKARLFWYVLYRTCGLEALQAMHRRAAQARVRLSTADVRRILQEETKRDLGPVFAGWTGPGEARFDIFGAASDADQDGLSDLDEALLGTDPAKPDTDGDGLSDGFEADRVEGARTLDPKDPADAAARGSTLAADGLAGEWKGVAALRLDDKGDGGAPGAPDLVSLRARVTPDGRALVVALGLEARPEGSWYVQVDLDAQGAAGGGGPWAHRVVVWPVIGVSDVRREGKSIDAGLLEWGAVGRVVEVAVPLALLGNPERVSLAARAGLDAGPSDAFPGVMCTLRARGPVAGAEASHEPRTPWDDAAPLARDPEGDAPFDATAVDARLSRDGRALLLRLSWRGEPPPDATVQIDLDDGADASYERRLLYAPKHRAVELWFLDARGFAGDGGVIATPAAGRLDLEIPLDAKDRPARIAAVFRLLGGGGDDALERVVIDTAR